MDYEKLKSHQTVLLDVYTSLSETLEEKGDEIYSELKAMNENIEAEKFLLAVVGEVKAGKSTFINALLGEEMLPFDTLQATSEIVEICHSEKKEVQVTFANGTTQIVEDDPETPQNEVVPFLKEIASVNEEYRDIPIVQVNRFLIDHYREAERKAVFEEVKLEDFISDPRLENTHNLGKEEFGNKIHEYIEKNISCDEIPERITLGYPHTFSEFKHFRIVDTPGINAIGGIEDQTKEFINQADAVIYLHKAGQLESKALRDALENELSERVKDRMILVLTHGSQSDENERKRILEATDSYYSKIGSDNIFFVDSLTELYLQIFFYNKSIDEIKAIRREYPEIRRLTADCFEMAEGDQNEFFRLLEKQANFNPIRERIKKDAQNSASIQMKDFADAIQEQYEALNNEMDAYIEFLKRENQSPQSFASEIKKQKCEMERMRIDYNEFTSKLREEFSPRGMNSRYYKKIDKLVKKFINEISMKEFDPNQHNEKTILSYCEKLRQDFSDKITNFVDSLEADFKKTIVDRNVEAQSDYSITVPIIPLGKIWNTAFFSAQNEKNKQLDEVEKSKKSWSDYWEMPFGTSILVIIIDIIKKEKIKDNIIKDFPQNLWDKVKGELKSNIIKGKTRLQEEIDAMVERFCDEYKYGFGGELKRRKQDMEDIEKKEKTNEELHGDILTMEAEKKSIEANIDKCVSVKREL